MNDGEIAGPDVASVILEEGGPRLTRLSALLRYIALHRPFADLDAQLEQLAANALHAPQMVLTRHLLNKVDGFLWDTVLPLPCPRFALPV